MKRKILNIALFLFFNLSLLVIIIYGTLLYYKVTRPAFKNLNTEDFTWFGILVILLIIANLFILKRFLKRIEKLIDKLRGTHTPRH